MTIDLATKFTEIENTFRQLNRHLDQCLLHKNVQFNNPLVCESINDSFKRNKSYLIAGINEQRGLFLKKLKEHLRLQLEHLENGNSPCQRAFFKKRSPYLLNRLTFSLLGSLYYENEFSLYKKLEYFDFFDLAEGIEEVKDVENPMQLKFINIIDNFNSSRFSLTTGYQLLTYVKQTDEISYLKILNKRSEELLKLQIEHNLIFTNCQCFGDRIVALFYDRSKTEHKLFVYNTQLVQLSSRSFDFIVSMLSINETEVILWVPNQHKILILDYEMTSEHLIGQIVDESGKFYFGNGSVIDANEKYAVFYYNLLSFDPESSYFNDFTNYIRVLSRKSGMSVGTIKFENEYFANILKLDLFGNVIYKPLEPNNVIQYYTPNGQLLKQITSDRLRDIDSLLLTKNNQIVCYNKRPNSVKLIEIV